LSLGLALTMNGATRSNSSVSGRMSEEKALPLKVGEFEEVPARAQRAPERRSTCASGVRSATRARGLAAVGLSSAQKVDGPNRTFTKPPTVRCATTVTVTCAVGMVASSASVNFTTPPLAVRPFTIWFAAFASGGQASSTTAPVRKNSKVSSA
jgi:hypothetical protein